ncbi:MAG: hypothetical protein HOV83_11975 [Catenulispora sp.]|nr:hypothetical protein [Catenulispora sp.]
MLGELIGELQGQTTGTRVVEVADGAPVVEVSFQGTGTFLDTATTELGTYTALARPDGTLFGDGQGMSTTADGDVVSWHGSGLGRMTGPGATSFRGAIFYSTASTRFAELNGVVGVFEFDTDESGKCVGTIYEWK